MPTGNKKRRIACRFRLEQRITDSYSSDDYGPIFSYMAAFFCVELGDRTQSESGRVYYKIEASSHKSLKAIIDYLDKYPLFSSKHLDYLG